MNKPGNREDTASPADQATGFPLVVVIAGVLSLICIVAVVATGLVLFQLAERNTIELTRERGRLMIEIVQDQVASTLAAVADQATYVTGLIGPADINVERIDRLGTILGAALAGTPEVSGLAIVDPSGIVFRARRSSTSLAPDLLDWSEDPEIQVTLTRAREATDSFWGRPFHAEASGRTFLNYYQPIYDRERFAGLLVTAIAIDDLSNLMSRLAEASASAAGQAVSAVPFVLYGRDAVLAHPLMVEATPGLSDEAPLPKISEFGDPVLAAMWTPAAGPVAEGLVGAFEARRIDAGGDPHVVIYREITNYGDTPWIIGLHVSVETLGAQMQRLSLVPWIVGIVVLLSIVASAFLSRILARPVERLSIAAAHVRELDIDGTPRLDRGFVLELNRAADAFNTMVQALRSFETYVPRALVGYILANYEGMGPPSEEREVTVMFTDIHGFTSLSEGRSAAEVATILNEHFTLIGACVEETSGTIDKYIGDSLMAFWGAPQPQADAAVRACRTALAIREAVDQDNDERARAGRPQLTIRIGIHTGPAIVGNIGAPGRINYTVVGDTVNVSQRLESLARVIACEDRTAILVSGDTARTLGAEFHLVPLGDHRMPGREQPIATYCLYRGDVAKPPAPRLESP